ncbi:hypothetical protein [Marinomonas mediterranea]|uniref:hypothetical protein n=1 Tax=Marinomonas mediterranea TaxID=119864 RepID=UPI0023492894|nr:hypothetical protein [Marinomonas mediterranea]WCN09995.1 hypothetical protein GV055_14225 [Marinomonas mediterranea]
MTPEEIKQLLPYTDHLDLSKEEKIEVIKLVWFMMESAVDQAWGINPVKSSRDGFKQNSLQKTQGSLDSKC